MKSPALALLGSRMKAFLDAPWDAETGEKLLDRLQTRCRTCHEPFRDE